MNNRVESGRQRPINGRAHEHIVVGILMKKYHHVSMVDLPLLAYDIIIILKKEDEPQEIIRAQVKTAKTSVVFTGGGRGGVDRIYRSGIKEYIQSTETSDIVIGIKPIDTDNYELYFVPTFLVEYLNQKSISLNRIRDLKNNYFILENCKNRELVLKKCKEYGII